MLCHFRFYSILFDLVPSQWISYGIEIRTCEICNKYIMYVKTGMSSISCHEAVFRLKNKEFIAPWIQAGESYGLFIIILYYLIDWFIHSHIEKLWTLNKNSVRIFILTNLQYSTVQYSITHVTVSTVLYSVR